MELRPYQKEAVQAVMDELQVKHSTLVALPTGCGKTPMFSVLIDRYLSQHGGKALVLAHREELLHQAIDKLESWTTRKVGLEQADNRVSQLMMPDVVVASVPTLSQPRRLQSFAPNLFSLIVTDECQHSTSDSYRAIYRYFNSARHLGVSATPERADRKALGAVFESVAYTYDIRDAIEQRYLVPLLFRRVLVEDLDLSRVRTVAGDFVEADLEEQFMQEKVLHEIADPLLKLAGERPTLAFSPGVRHAYALAEILKGYRDGCAEAIDGKLNSIDRERRLRDFREGRTQVLLNMGILTEGVDIPSIACVANCRPTKSRSLFCQIVGRGTRPHPESGKTNCLVLDFTDVSQQHSLISPVDIMDGNTDLEVKERAERLCQQHPDMNVLDAMALAEEQLGQEEQQRELEKRQKLIAKTVFRAVEVDPLAIIGIRPRAGRWGGAEITVKQKETLERNGIPCQGLDKGQAMQVISKIIERRELGLCSLKQAKHLVKWGINPDISFEQASQVMNVLAQSGWRPSPELVQKMRQMAA